MIKLPDWGKIGLWQKKSNSVVGIDIGSASVKAVQLRKDKGQSVLETYGEIAVGPYRGLSVGQAAVLPVERLSELLKDLFIEANISVNNARFAIPLSSSLLTIMTIPKVEESLLPKVVPIEARKYIPVPVGEVALDWWVIPKKEPSLSEEDGKPVDQTLEVLLVAIHQSVINQYEETARAVGLLSQNLAFELETFSAIRSVFTGEMTPTVILDLGARTTKMAVVDYGVIRLSHTINKGAQDLTLAISHALGVDFAKAEEIKRKVGLVERLENSEVAATVSNIIEYIFLEAGKVIAAYQQKYHRAVAKVILIGGGVMLRGLEPLIKRSFEVPVVYGRPFTKVQAPAFLEDILNQTGFSFAVATGLALRHLEELE